MNMVMVPMAESTLARLIAEKSAGENLDDTVQRLLFVSERPAVSARSPELSAQTIELRKPVNTRDFEPPIKAPIAGRQQLVLLGQAFRFRDKLDVWRAFMRELVGLVPDKLDALMAVRFTKRRILARSKAEIYSGRIDLNAEEVAPDLWIPTNCGGPDIIRYIRAACSAIGLEFAKDVIVNFN